MTRERVPGVDGHYEPEVAPVPDAASAVLAYLFTGPLVLGGAGWGLDTVLTTRFFLPAGVLLGLAAGLYLVFLRYGGT